MMRIDTTKIQIYSYAEEGIISSEDIGEGRMIPAIVLDVKDNQDIMDLIKLHYSITTGDVEMTWIQDFFNRKDFILRMIFKKPMQIKFGIRFNIAKDFALIDGINQSKGLYLQTGKKGDKISKKLDEEKILIEVPDLGVKELWNKMIMKTLVEKYRKLGYNKKESNIVAKQHLKSIRDFWKIRRNV